MPSLKRKYSNVIGTCTVYFIEFPLGLSDGINTMTTMSHKLRAMM